MTKTLKLILLLSLAANALLLLGVAAGLFSLGKPAATAHTVAKRAPTNKTLSPEAATAATALLTLDDPAALRDRLRAMGLSEDMVRTIVTASIKSRHAARLREIDNEAVEAFQKKPYWQHNVGGVTKSWYWTAEQIKEQDAISRDEQEQIKQVLGEDGATGITDIRTLYAAQALMNYSAFLPPEKAARLSGIDRDYDDLRTQMLVEMAGFRMPGDDAKLKLLDDEKQRDIQALLTLDEQAAMKLHDSPSASLLQGTFSAFDGTEEEYKAIFALKSASTEKFMEALSMSSYGGVDVSYQKQFAEEETIEAQIKTLLGDERYAQYQRAERGDYSSLLAAAQRFNLSPETVSQTYQARDDAVTEAMRISSDESLTTGQRKQAYAALTEQATAQIRATLGDDIGDAYIDNALDWFKQLSKGGTVHTLPKTGDVFVVPPRAAKAGKAGKKKK